ncbi:cyclopropane-fatty-acyl-phospholipid synthase [Xylariales sp. AK1849]|nr:cyclopropane-fatty-acyl-phospholipid synthase [Xylariales sp. AK1849]
MTSTDPPFSTIRYLPTKVAYDRWAAVYDTDGNFLQALDNIEMKQLLPHFEASIESARPWKLVDLGCGTGRNTALLLAIGEAQIVALDASSGMLAVAHQRLNELKDRPGTSSVRDLHLEVFDLLTSPCPPAIAAEADGIISTLVIEHIPLSIFFSHVSRMLKSGGVLLLTNMHAHMGSISQAGFVDTQTGEKIRPTSYAHTVADAVAEAAKWGLTVEEEEGIRERDVSEKLVEMLGPRSRKWIGVTCWFGGLFRKTG